MYPWLFPGMPATPPPPPGPTPQCASLSCRAFLGRWTLATRDCRSPRRLETEAKSTVLTGNAASTRLVVSRRCTTDWRQVSTELGPICAPPGGVPLALESHAVRRGEGVRILRPELAAPVPGEAGETTLLAAELCWA